MCDAYDAIISERCYRPARSPEAARQELAREAGRQFDPTVVGAVLEAIDEIRSVSGSRLGELEPSMPALAHA